MNLVYLSNAKLPTTKAHGLQIMKSCEAFAKAGVSVELRIPRRFNSMAEDPFVYYGVRQNFSIRKLFSLELRFLPERARFYLQIASFAICAGITARGDVMYSRDPIILFVLCLFGRQPVAELHDYRSTRARWWMRYLLRHARSVIVNSEGTKSLLMQHYPNARAMRVVPNAVDPRFFDIPETKQEAREKLNLPQDKIIVGYVGRLEVAGQSKGVPMLKEAFELMELRDKAELLLVVSVPYRHVPLYLRAIDIAVIPFPDKRHAATTSPMKLYEYQAAKKAIVIADSPDPLELAKKLDAMVRDPKPSTTQPHTWDQRAANILAHLS